ncbi:MAG: glycosyltransferase family 1 protein [Acidimicrobiia bacterium]|nr:glycosyltransferase family 1 protein [Acidimicrobiia bacterium]
MEDEEGSGADGATGAAQIAGAPSLTGRPIRVAYTLEQCWHTVPGGTAVAALEVAREFRELPDLVESRYVAGRHPNAPAVEYRPDGPVAMLPLARPLLYETWNRLNWPKVEAVTGEIDVAHATGLVPCGTNAPLVVTVHDLAFVHDPEKFTRHGARVMNRSLDVIRRRADLVICSSQVTLADCADNGIDRSRLRLVPLGVRPSVVDEAAVRRVRRKADLPDEFVLFVGTVEPRKNLSRLVEAMRGRREPLVVVGAEGWGDVGELGRPGDDVRFLGFVSDDDRSALYAAATVFAYPSEREGYGLPVGEAMAAGTPVVTSLGTSTEEVAGGAAVLVDPFDPAAIAAGIEEAFDRRVALAAAGLVRAGELGWDITAQRTLDVYRELLA